MAIGAQGGIWETKAPMPTARTGSATGVIAGKLYVVAGATGGAPTGFTALEVYDPASDSWTIRAPAPTSRAFASAGVIDGKLYVVGGCVNSDCFSRTNILEVYDPATNIWTTKTPMPTARATMATGVIAGKLYVVGGFDFCSGACPDFDTLEVYDPATNSWTTKAPMPTARSQMDGAVINGKLYVVGGTTDGSDLGRLATLEVYDPSTDGWTTKAPMPTPRFALGAGEVNGILYAVSGHAAGSINVNTVEAYNPATDTWITVAPIPTGRSYIKPQRINGVLYVAGSGAGNTPISTLEAFTPEVTDITAPVTTISSAVDGNGAAIAGGDATLSSSIAFTFQGTDAVGVVGFRCSLDAAPYVTCSSPATYSALAVGTHTFQVRAMDAAGNVAIPASFAWTVLTPAQAIQSLLTTVTSMGLPAGVANSLSAPLKNIDTNNLAAACGKLNAFVNQVNAKVKNGELTMPQSSELLQAANAIKASLGCA